MGRPRRFQTEEERKVLIKERNRRSYLSCCADRVKVERHRSWSREYARRKAREKFYDQMGGFAH